jgi:methyl-accepting chemotaxis protein
MSGLHQTTAGRLWLLVGGLLAALLVTAGTAWVKLQDVRSATNDIADNWLPSVDRVNRMNTNTSDLRILQWQHVINTDEKRMAEIERMIDVVMKDFESNRAPYEALISSAEERELYDRFMVKWTAYLADHAKLLQESRQNQTEQARARLEGDSQKLYDLFSATLLELVDLNSAGGAAARTAAEAAHRQAVGVLGLLTLVGTMLALGTALWVIRSITRPLGAAVQSVEQIAQGDLAGRIEADGRDEVARLMTSLARMQDSLVRTVRSVREGAEGVATASVQVAQGNSDLSRRTEQTAAALQQTAATMDELGSTVRNNADSAQQANGLAQGASSVASEGGQLVHQVVDTMQSISASSRRIGDIIGVIDGIAFQTNILALNAAVEAARAGEQGRGFAVVAAEVRSLAQRSAEAAKEIKGLISQNVEHVERGVQLVDSTGRTMSEIVGSIGRVTAIVGEISHASVEQSNGIAQVGTAINQMDQGTQQNAALVEQSAAAAESLKTQADQLVAAVASFRLQAA